MVLRKRTGEYLSPRLKATRKRFYYSLLKVSRNHEQYVPLKMSHFVQFYIQVASLGWILQLFHSQLCEPFSEVLFDPKKIWRGMGPFPPTLTEN